MPKDGTRAAPARGILRGRKQSELLGQRESPSSAFLGRRASARKRGWHLGTEAKRDKHRLAAETNRPDDHVAGDSGPRDDSARRLVPPDYVSVATRKCIDHAVIGRGEYEVVHHCGSAETDLRKLMRPLDATVDR